MVAQARAGFFPTFDLNASAQRSRTGGGSSSSTGVNRSGFTTSAFSTSASASWVPDLWGKIRRTVEGDVASALASAGNLASARLSAQGALASDYLQLRMSDELKRLFDAAASYYAESLRIIRAISLPSPKPRLSSRARRRRRSPSAWRVPSSSTRSPC